MPAGLPSLTSVYILQLLWHQHCFMVYEFGLLSPIYSKKSGGILFSFFGDVLVVVRGSGFLVRTLSSQLLLQFKDDPFETLHGLRIRMFFFRILIFCHSFRMFYRNVFRGLIPQKSIGRMHPALETPPTV